MFSYLIVSSVVVQWFAQLPHTEKVVGSIANFFVWSLHLLPVPVWHSAFIPPSKNMHIRPTAKFQVVHTCECCCGWLFIPIWHHDKPVTCLPSPSGCWDRLQHPVTLSAGGVVTESGLMANQGKCVSSATLTSQ